ncbi:MAG: DUF742 domain-containing protein [Actinomycetota bacterium]|nr:DUF742 domain-containing protein [Actinomycetota bacterium]
MSRRLTASWPDAAAPGPFVRPYAITGGRTRSRHSFPLEALVLTTVQGEQSTLAPTPEARTICELCRSVRSVAEVGALVGVPLGVARVLIGDLMEHGLVMVSETVDDSGPDTGLLEKVLSGLRRL